MKFYPKNDEGRLLGDSVHLGFIGFPDGSGFVSIKGGVWGKHETVLLTPEEARELHRDLGEAFGEMDKVNGEGPAEGVVKVI